jgi:hypothetical protein
MSVALLPHVTIKKRCNRGNHEVLPSEIVCGDDRAGYICMACYHRHHLNLDRLAQRRPRECDECHRAFGTLGDRELIQNINMIEKDGWLAVLCNQCMTKYAKVAHQIKGTAYERKMKIR